VVQRGWRGGSPDEWSVSNGLKTGKRDGLRERKLSRDETLHEHQERIERLTMPEMHERRDGLLHWMEAGMKQNWDVGWMKPGEDAGRHRGLWVSFA
jgi:hypothetical protein